MVPALDKEDPGCCGIGRMSTKVFHPLVLVRLVAVKGDKGSVLDTQKGARNSQEAPGLQRLAVPSSPSSCPHQRSSRSSGLGAWRL